MKKVLCEVSPFTVENQSSVPLETSLKPLNTVGNLHQLSQLGVKKLGYLYSIYYSIPSWGLLQAPNLQQLHFARSSKQPSVGSVQQGGRRELSQDSPPFSPDCSPFPSSTFSIPPPFVHIWSSIPHRILSENPLTLRHRFFSEYMTPYLPVHVAVSHQPELEDICNSLFCHEPFPPGPPSHTENLNTIKQTQEDFER